ncbi:MAG TPA: DUF2270 domain-containing protein [Promineifilum sp.]|nr:DUF2270 domain-containing protein [Promineifilum sp.]
MDDETTGTTPDGTGNNAERTAQAGAIAGAAAGAAAGAQAGARAAEAAAGGSYEPVWTFRGYKLRPSEFNTAMVHYYRAEIQRSNVWRSRLDTTTNWAVVTVAASITFVFAAPENHWGVFLLVMLLVLLFLFIEARRYRYYELWSLRARLMETDFFAAMLVPPFAPHADWDETLAESLLQPQFPISRLEAVGRRLRNNYLSIFAILNLGILLKLYLHPFEARSAEMFIERAHLGPLHGGMVLAGLGVFMIVLLLTTLVSQGLQEASGEVLPKYNIEDFLGDLWPLGNESDNAAATGVTGTADGSSWSRLSRRKRRRPQLLALVVAANPQHLADRIIAELHRGATALHGQGMYLKQERDVLLVALTVTEIEHLKAIVREEDPQAFITIIPAKEVVGQGFVPLEKD